MLDRSSRQLTQRLKTTGLALGLLRLQLDAGRGDEARLILAALQDDFQVLLHGVAGQTKNLFAKSYAESTSRAVDPCARKRFNPSLSVRSSAKENSGARCRV
jgi:MoxR-like ATPase